MKYTDMKAKEAKRYKTIARMVLVCNGREYPYEYDFGFAYPVDTARFMWESGNYSCDCNKSLFLSRVYPEVVVTDCGNEIEVKNLTVTQEKCVPEELI